MTETGSVAVVGVIGSSALVEPSAGDKVVEAGASAMPPLPDPAVELEALGGALAPL